MAPNEKELYTYIIERTKPEHQDEMRQLAAELLVRKETKRLSKFYLMSVAPRALSYLKPESINEVQDAIKKISSNL